jgi:hypothetical protein
MAALRGKRCYLVGPEELSTIYDFWMEWVFLADTLCKKSLEEG